jgi:starch synthase
MIKEHLLFAASEVYPFAKTGGLADVAYALPRTLNELYDVEVVMPLYRSVDRQKYNIEPIAEAFDLIMGGVSYEVQFFGCTYQNLHYRFIFSPLLCERDFLYGSPEAGYGDNAIRFGLFNYALLSMIEQKEYDAVHLNDWQCGLLPLLLQERPNIHPKTLYTIHNLAYQGTFSASDLNALGIDEKYFTMEGIEFYGQINFMKAGIAYADIVTTVSPTYAKEILTEGFGCGLEGFLESHRNKLVGVLNGIDIEHFSPQKDTSLISPYSDGKGKRPNKSDYLKSIGLKGVNKPLFIFVGRFTHQKGLKMLIDALPKMASLECNIAILGEGEAHYYNELQSILGVYPNVYLYFGYDEVLSHRMYAAADFLLMPSLFEPCGLNQLIAFSYGAVPVVHRVGGLVDTVKKVEKFNPSSPDGFGITFERPTERSFFNAITKAMELFSNKRLYNSIVNHNMSCDFSWKESAKVYIALYRSIKP